MTTSDSAILERAGEDTGKPFLNEQLIFLKFKKLIRVRNSI
jgi:hypothetical protein